MGGIERGERNPALVNIAALATALGVSLEAAASPSGEQRSLVSFRDAASRDTERLAAST